MLAAHHDQENVYTHQAGASKQQLQAKTPGARYPKTPLKIPLNDENANYGFCGKSAFRAKGNNENVLTVGKGGNGVKPGKAAMVTPAEPRTARAPLGNKTTNAKARATHQTPGVKPLGRDIEKATNRPTSNRRLKQAPPYVEAPKLEVHTDRNPLEEEEIEYAPPKPKDLPYESDVFPDGVLTFEGLKPENLFKGYYQYYHNRVDAEGKTALERQMEERKQESFKRGEEQILKDMEEFDWSVGDIPESKDLFRKKKSTVAPASTASTTEKSTVPGVRQPSTIASRKAASALAMPARATSASQTKLTKTTTPAAAKPPAKSYLLPKRQPAQTVPQPTIPTRERAAAVAASRSTLGYNKGRSVSSAVHGTNSNSTSRHPSAAPKPRALVRSISTASTGSDATITPARFAQASQEWKKPDFLSIFDADEDESNLGGCMPPMDDDDDDGFQLTVNFH
ncbi:hypothetical protein VTI74DRAFT_7893 [Chaetomium olivicolor]